jgi:hypothetical protein
MPTTTLEVGCNVRPSRLAFVLPDLNSSERLLEVICLATSLWGGVFDPIVVLDANGRTVRGSQETLTSAGDYLQEQAKLLREFDPDFLIEFCGRPLPCELSQFQHRTFGHEKLYQRIRGNEEVVHFLEVWPALQTLWREEMRFSTPRDSKFRFIEKAESAASAYLTARFGAYRANDSYEVLRRYFDAAAVSYDDAFMSALELRQFVFPISLTAQRCLQPRPGWLTHAYFLLDPLHLFDVVDYWNLRAAGMRLLPLTLGDYKAFEKIIRQFGEEATYPINERVTNHPTLIKARSMEEQQVEEVAGWIRSLGFLKDFSTMGWVPRFGERGYRVAPEIEVKPISCLDSNHIAVLTDGYGVVQGNIPPFDLQGAAWFQHWSTEMSFYSSHDPELCFKMPWLNVGCDRLAGRIIGHGFELNASRVSRTGIVSHHHGDRGDIRLSPVSAKDIIKAFLDGNGLTYKGTSTAGLALERIIESLDGLRGCRVFQNSAIRDILNRLSNGSWLRAADVRGMLNRSVREKIGAHVAVAKEEVKSQVNSLLNAAVDARVLRIGLEFQCSKCRRHGWYATTEFRERFACKFCFAEERVPRLDTAAWCYASDGFYRSNNKMDGNITVMLALNFLTQFLEHGTPFIPSFNYIETDAEREADFAILVADLFQDDVRVVFGEAKSGTQLNEEERHKMRTLASKTHSYLCFCTLASDFDENDKAFFRKLIDDGIKPILLTRCHLDMDYLGVMTFRSRQRAAPVDKTELLFRMTGQEILGNDFMVAHHLWL